jgi:hypothetical protein
MFASDVVYADTVSAVVKVAHVSITVAAWTSLNGLLCFPVGVEAFHWFHHPLYKFYRLTTWNEKNTE